MPKQFKILLGGELIGYTQLEFGDAPMGVAWGSVYGTSLDFNYDFFLMFCKKNNIEIAEQLPDIKYVSTRTVEALKVIDTEGSEVKGEGNQLRWIEGNPMELSIEGIPDSIYSVQFPHHIEEYNQRFK